MKKVKLVEVHRYGTMQYLQQLNEDLTTDPMDVETLVDLIKNHVAVERRIDLSNVTQLEFDRMVNMLRREVEDVYGDVTTPEQWQQLKREGYAKLKASI